MNLQTLKARLDAYERLMRLDKPIGILLLLWPTLWGLWLGRGGVPPLMLLWLFVLGTVLMRSAGCAINDFADRRFDREVVTQLVLNGQVPGIVGRQAQLLRKDEGSHTVRKHRAAVGTRRLPAQDGCRVEGRRPL